MKTPRFRKHRTLLLAHEERVAPFSSSPRSVPVVVILIIALVGGLIAALIEALL